VAISYIQLNRVRERLFLLVKSWGYKCATYISTKALVWRTAKVGENCFILENNVIQHGVVIEDNVILWGQVGVQKDLTIGKGAVVLGQSGIGKSLDAGKTYFGSPTRDAIDKMRELALLKRLPEVFERLDKSEY
jgi:UDP-3-O-[3-hydroxymyristoyl] glucosamine N-acyltransferase